MSGGPSRIVSRKPCTAGPNARRRIRSRFTMLMPTLTLTRSAGGVPHGAGRERVEQRAAGEAEVDQLHAASLGSDRRPGGARAVGDRALADRAAVVQPDPAVTRGGEDRRVRAQLHQVGGLAPRQPQLDELVAVRQPDEPHRAARPAPGLGPAREVQHHLVAAGDAHLRGQLAVDAEVVEAVRPRRHALVVRDDPMRVQLHLGGPAPEHQPYAGRLRLGHEQLVGRRTGPGPTRAAGGAAARARSAPARPRPGPARR